MNRTARIVCGVAILSAAVRGFLAWRWYGFQTGDDLEIAEEAFRVAVGLVHQPWDIRSLFVPDVLVAPFVWIASLCGLHDPLWMAGIARLPFIFLGAINIVLLFHLGRRWYDERTALIAASLYAVHWIPLVYGSSSYPRTFAVTCILAAALLLERFPFIAGLFAALATTTRYSEAIFLISLLVIARSRQTVVALSCGFIVGFVIFVGVYDRLTWGHWFSSLMQFTELTFARRDASSLNVRQPLWWYFSSLPHWIPITALPLIYIAARRSELRRFVAFIALPVLALSLIFHKELRYLQVVIPFVALLAAYGFTIAPWRRAIAVALLVLAFPLALGRIGTVARRTNNAVDAALWIAQQRPKGVALSQGWAYGGRLFLGNAPIIADIGIPPDAMRISALAPNIEYVAVYSSEVDTRAMQRFAHSRTFEGRGGRAVTVFY